jgi:hypothetical protein
MEETFSKRCGSRTWSCDGRDICDTTKNVVRSNRTTSSADNSSEKDCKCDSMTSIFGMSDCTIEDHAYDKSSLDKD